MKDLEKLTAIEDPVRRRAMFIAILSKEMTKRGGVAPIVVGGEAVEIYTQGSYTTGDIDIIAPLEIMEAVLKEWGFDKTGRMWINRELDMFIDWRGGTLEGKLPELIELAEGLEVKVISAEDLVIDRLNAAKYWGDTDSLMWAKVIIRLKKDVGGLDMDYLKEKAEKEGIPEFLREALS